MSVNSVVSFQCGFECEKSTAEEAYGALEHGRIKNTHTAACQKVSRGPLFVIFTFPFPNLQNL